MGEMFARTYLTLIGKITILDSDGSIAGILLPCDNLPCASDRETDAIAEAAAEISEYLSGRRKHFGIPTVAEGTDFQMTVWDALSEIPYGEVRTYGDIAREIGNPGSARAVGAAAGANPLAIVVPCHRVVAANGPGGYRGGAVLKKHLLELESGSL
jgi:methylated-DNA-[protein]-cysteine S-methyltransferase